MDPIIFCILDKAQELAWKAVLKKKNKETNKNHQKAKPKKNQAKNIIYKEPVHLL